MAARARLSELLFLGTGTSGNVPNIWCLTREPPTCEVCLSAMTPPAATRTDIGTFPRLRPPPQARDRRRNTSALARFPHSDGRVRNVLVDCGKTFYESALTWFTTHRLRRIDAVLLTHGHADAVFGLDDLRAWTIGGAAYSVQDVVDVYLDSETYEVVSRAFPYIADRGRATGGGEVPSVRFHVFGSRSTGYQSITIDNELVIEPVPVNHGVYPDGSPFPCLGFKFGDDVTYISDASEIPQPSMDIIAGSNLVVLDGLHDREHLSHFSIEQAVTHIKRVLPRGGAGYLTGFSHGVRHAELEDRLAKRTDLSNAGITIQPAYDGLMLNVDDIRTRVEASNNNNPNGKDNTTSSTLRTSNNL